jgi:hypothetical protein
MISEELRTDSRQICNDEAMKERSEMVGGQNLDIGEKSASFIVVISTPALPIAAPFFHESDTFRGADIAV